MRRTGIMLATLTATLAGASGAQGQAPITVTRFAQTVTAPSPTNGWNEEANAAGAFTNGCFDGGSTCRQFPNPCAAYAPTNDTQRAPLFALSWSALPATITGGHVITSVKVDAYGSRTGGQAANWRMTVGGPITRAPEVGTITGNCGWLFDRANPDTTSWDVTGTRAWTRDDSNTLQVGIAYLTTANIPNDYFFISGFRQQVVFECAAIQSITISAPTTTLCPTASVRLSANVITDSRITSGLTYRWFRGQTLVGTESFYDVTGSNADTYTCVVNTGCRTAEATITITALAAPTISNQPVAQTTCAGGSRTFTVSVTGTPAPTIQWRRNGANLTNGASFGSVYSGVNTTTLTISGVDPAAAGDYDAVVVNTCGSVDSEDAGLTVNTAPSITTQPMPRVVCQSGTTTFTIGVIGTPAPTIQWRRNGVNLANGPSFDSIYSGVNTTTLTISSVAPAAAGDYDVVVSNVCDSSTSSTASLTVNTAPSITTQPIPQAVCQSGTTSFTIAVAGTPAPTIQWRRNGANLTNGPSFGSVYSGVNTTTLTISNAAPAAAGNYDAVVVNTCGSVDSEDAGLTVNTAPSITTQPTPRVVCQSGTTTFTIAVTGTPAPAIQWRRNGVNLANGPSFDSIYSGVNTTTLTISNVAPAAAGNYDAVVSNVCGSSTSSAASLTVNPSVTSLAISPAAPSVCLTGSVTLTATAAPAGSFTYQWFRNALPIAGATNSTLSIPSARVRDAARYTVSVTSTCNTLTSQPVDLTVLEHPVWTPLDAPQPVARFGGAMAYDPVRNVTVLFGGQTSAGFRNDTWEWNGQAWTLRNPAAPPTARAFSAMAFDRVRNVMVLVGGRNTNGPISETWEYNGTAWALQPGPSPTARDRAGMVWDAANNRMVLFGGFGPTSTLGDTWFRSGQTWTNSLLPGPANRTAHLDPARQRRARHPLPPRPGLRPLPLPHRPARRVGWLKHPPHHVGVGRRRLGKPPAVRA